MPLTIRDTKTTPREKRWTYPAVDGTEISSNSYMNLRREIQQHYEGNGQPAPDEETIHKYLCENLSIPCFKDGVAYRNRFTDPIASRRPGIQGKEWPFALQPLKLLARDGDKGLGSIVERVIGPIGGDLFKAWHQKIFGNPCSCGDRRDKLDEDYPL